MYIYLYLKFLYKYIYIWMYFTRWKVSVFVFKYFLIYLIPCLDDVTIKSTGMMYSLSTTNKFSVITKGSINWAILSNIHALSSYSLQTINIKDLVLPYLSELMLCTWVLNIARNSPEWKFQILATLCGPVCPEASRLHAPFKLIQDTWIYTKYKH